MHRCTKTQFVNFLHAPNVFCLLQASLINGFVNQPESYSVELLMGLELYYEKGCFLENILLVVWRSERMCSISCSFLCRLSKVSTVINLRSITPKMLHTQSVRMH